MKGSEIISKNKYKIFNSDNIIRRKNESKTYISEIFDDEKESAYLTPPSKTEHSIKIKKSENIVKKDTKCELIITIIFVIIFVFLATYLLFFEKLTKEQLLNNNQTTQENNNNKKNNIDSKRRNEIDKNKEEESWENNNNTENVKIEKECEEGYYLPIGHIHCIKCSLKHCAKCEGYKSRDNCIACKESFTPIFGYESQIIECNNPNLKCDKGVNEKCLTCDGEKCGSCNNGYQLINGECKLIYSFKGLYKTKDPNESVILINKRYKEIIKKVIIDGQIFKYPIIKYTFKEKGIHTVYFCIETSNLNTGTNMFFFFFNLRYIEFTEEFNTIKMISMKKMFKDCINLHTIILSEFNTTNVSDFSFMFDNCSSLQKIDLSNFQTKKAKDLSYMFSNCKSLKSLSLKYFNTSKVVDMGGMFSNCSSLTSIDISRFNTENTKNMFYMFSGCLSLRRIDMSYFKIDNVKDISYMFNNCTSLKYLDLHKFQFTKVTKMEGTFMGCKKITFIDLRNFSAKNLTNGNKMFFDCERLEKVDISHFEIASWNKKDKLFNSIIGKNGRIYIQESFVDKIKENIPVNWEIRRPHI